MTIKRYTAAIDTTITNAFKENASTRATSANLGASDSMEVFSIWGQTSSSADGSSLEKARMLVKFPVDSISTDRSDNNIPVSGSVNFYLRLFNAVHPNTLPRDFTLSILPVSESWDEGYGLDMETYGDTGEASWDDAQSAVAWGTAGGTYHTESAALLAADSDMHEKNVRTLYEVSFADGTEDLEIDISELVEQWIDGTKSNYGVGVMMSGAYEDGSLSGSFYTKKFFTRTSEFFFRRPTIEARWDAAKADDRANFYASSSLVPGADNVNTLYLYNWVRGQLKNIPDLHSSETLVVKLYRDALTDNVPQEVTGGLTSNTGIYSASINIETTASSLHDVWSTGSTEFHTGSEITVKSFKALAENPNPNYITSMVNLRSSYSKKETARFRLFIRKQNWSPTIYTKATETLDSEIIDSAFYKIFRASDNFEVVPYGTGSTSHTKLSYDQSGSYFDFDMSLLEADFAYGLNFVYYLNGKYVEQPEVFKFRVEE
ncbi:MAG TPA: hypothetical protein EYN38_05180 [Flavobacteriales bacterium]|nr:hypothetical protein [Flavobacteriales bacterium]